MSDTCESSRDTLLAEQLIDAIPSPIAYKDAQGRYLGANKAFETYCGVKRDALIGKTVYDIWPKDLADGYRAADLEVLRRPGAHIHAGELVYADGNRRQVVFHRSTFSREDGSLGGTIGIAWDVTDRIRAERALQDELRFAEQMIDTVPSPIFFKDKNGHYLGCNRAFEEFCGLKRNEIIGKTAFDIFPHELAQTYYVADQALLKTGGVQVRDATIRSADGVDHDVIFHRAVFRKADGEIDGVIGVFWDVTERKRAEQSLRRSEDRFRRMVENAPFGVRLTDEAGTIVFTNRRFAEMVHYPLQQIATLQQWRVLAYPDARYRAEIMAEEEKELAHMKSTGLTSSPVREVHVTCGDGLVRDMEVVATLDDNFVYWVFNDVTARNRAEQALREVLQAEALHDPLTALFNRRYLDQEMEREFSRAARSGTPVSVVMADIDHFKPINDGHGHDCGDRVLQSIARVLSAHIRKGDTACRYGGDEFTLVLPDTSVDAALKRMQHICAMVRDLSVSCAGKPVGTISMSFGIAAYPLHGDTPEAVIKAADGALQHAKRDGRDRVSVAH
ncbi:diguanylate cyclase [Microbacteriaceae bacterium K1510]|nr:diguanylate cyclase [Microbacteriaceae bacterium K1510]